MTHRTRLWFAAGVLVLLGALLIRLQRLNWGLPYILHPDEPTNLGVVLAMIEAGDPNPHFFSYPSLFFYLHLPGQWLVSALGGALPRITMQAMATGVVEPPAAFIAARLITAGFGLGLVALVMVWAAELRLAAWAVLLSGAAVAFNDLLLRHSVLATPDVLAAFFTTLALFASSRIVAGRDKGSLLLAGLAVGLAASVKYNAGSVAVAVAAALLLRHGVSRGLLRQAVLSGACAAAAFLATSPFFLLDLGHALAGLKGELHHYRTGHAGNEGGALAFNLRAAFAQAGPAILALPFAALGGRGRRLVPALVFVALYFTLISVQQVRFDRNLLPLLPALLLLTVAGGHRALGLARAAWRPLLAGLFALAVALPWAATACGALGYQRDPGAGARAWLDRVLPRSGPVLADGYSPFVSGSLARAVGPGTATTVLAQDVAAVLRYDAVILTRQGSGRYLAGGYETERSRFAQLRAQSCRISSYPDAPAPFEVMVIQLRCP